MLNWDLLQGLWARVGQRACLPGLLIVFTLCGCGDTANPAGGGGSTGSGSPGPYQVAAWGDSLTSGNEDGTGITYPNRLALLTGQTVTNLGIGGQTSSQIAVRMNAYAGEPEQTFASAFTIPASGTVDVTFQTGFEPVNIQYHADYPNGVPLTFTVAGQNYTGNVIETGTTYVFTPAPYPAAPVAVPAGTAWTVVLPAGINSGCAVIWAGTNNLLSPAQVQADDAAMVATVQQSTNCYLVMGIPNNDSPDEWKGTTYYDDIIALNNALSATYSPGNHYLDIRAAVIAQYDPNNPADVLDHANDVWPYTLRALDLTGTLTTPVASPATCAFTSSTALGPGEIISVNDELIQITGGANGAYTCVRGYADTTPETYASGAGFTGVDALHLGQNAQSPQNPKYTNGYSAVAAQVYAWLQANGPK
jgi:hypothetical protein